MSRQLWPVLGIAFVAGGGCQSIPRSTVAAPELQSTRVNCYSLLHELLDQQRNVDKLLVIKLESANLRDLIKAIASASGTGADALKSMASRDGTLRLDGTALPAGEVATRDSIARAKARELLTPFNSDFELQLPLTQFQALSYASHLSKIAAENEPDPERARFLSRLGDQMRALHGRTFSLIRERRSGPRAALDDPAEKPKLHQQSQM